LGATVEPGASALGSAPTDASLTVGVDGAVTASGVPDSSLTTGAVAIALASAVTTGDAANVGVGGVDGAVGDDGGDDAADECAACGTNEYDSRATGTCLWVCFTMR
jgi:hypothetical protein